jgi:hypothetical protein
VSFEPPTTLYQRCQFRIDSPEDTTLSAGTGIGYYRERIQFQVFVIAEPNQGTAAALTRAELIRNLFKKGTTLLEGSYRIYVLTTPKVGSTAQIGTRSIVPVMVDVITEVYS